MPTPETKNICKCACHDDPLKRTDGYLHDTQCCPKMNGTLDCACHEGWREGITHSKYECHGEKFGVLRADIAEKARKEIEEECGIFIHASDGSRCAEPRPCRFHNPDGTFRADLGMGNRPEQSGQAQEDKYYCNGADLACPGNDKCPGHHITRGTWTSLSPRPKTDDELLEMASDAMRTRDHAALVKKFKEHEKDSNVPLGDYEIGHLASIAVDYFYRERSTDP